VLALGSAYVDGATTPGERMALRLHLLVCGHCRKFVRALRLTVRTVEQVPVPADELQVQRILSRIPPAD
jgi:hypothetical protein